MPYWLLIILFASFECQISKPWGEVKSGTDSPAKEKLSGMLYRISCSDLKRFDASKKQQSVWGGFILYSWQMWQGTAGGVIDVK